MLRQFLSLVTAPTDHHLAEQYREMHARRAFPGRSWEAHVAKLRECVPNAAQLRIVDFGCGPLGGLAQHFPENVIPYDPYVEEFSTPPWDKPFDVLFSSDVLEHVPIADIVRLFEKVHDAMPLYVFLNVSTRKAFKCLPDGTNAHITVKPARWWLDTIGRYLNPRYSPTCAQEDLLRSEVTLCLKREE